MAAAAAREVEGEGATMVEEGEGATTEGHTVAGHMVVDTIEVEGIDLEKKSLSLPACVCVCVRLQQTGTYIIYLFIDTTGLGRLDSQSHAMISDQEVNDCCNVSS